MADSRKSDWFFIAFDQAQVAWPAGDQGTGATRAVVAAAGAEPTLAITKHGTRVILRSILFGNGMTAGAITVRDGLGNATYFGGAAFGFGADQRGAIRNANIELRNGLSVSVAGGAGAGGATIEFEQVG